MTDVAKKYARISRLLRIEGPGIRQSAFSLIRTMRQYNTRLGIPATIKELGISKEEFESVLDEMCKGCKSRQLYLNQSERMYAGGYQKDFPAGI